MLKINLLKFKPTCIEQASEGVREGNTFLRRGCRLILSQNSGAGLCVAVRLLPGFRGSFRLCGLFNAVSYCGMELVNIYVCQFFELNAIASYTGLAYCLSVGLGQIFFVFDAHNINRNPCRVCADANLIKFPGPSVGIFYGLKAIPYLWIGNNFSILVFTVKKP